MNLKELDALLRKEEEIEILQKTTGLSVNDLNVPFDDQMIQIGRAHV